MSHLFGPSDSWYQPPEPPEPCCSEYEDACACSMPDLESRDDGLCNFCLNAPHDWQACMDEQAEAAAEAKAERMREDRMEDERDPTGWL